MSSLWIARDKDGELYIYSGKPSRSKERYAEHFDMNKKSKEIFDASLGYQRYLPLEKNAFPEVTWENSPKELIIKEE